MKKFALLAIVAVLCAPLMAQDRLEIFGGYQYLHNGNITINGQSQPGSSQGYNGWEGAAQFNFSHHLGVEGDFSGVYATVNGVSQHIYTYAGGPVVFFHAGGIKPFVHVLVGGTSLAASEQSVSVSTNGYTVMFGGGVDAKLNRLLALRVAQVDWLYYHFSGFNGPGLSTPSFSGSSNVRISTGVVLHF
jgi:hypothetical protein